VGAVERVERLLVAQLKLAQPLHVKGLELANRFVGLPIGLSGYVDQHGSPMERLFALFRTPDLAGSSCSVAPS